MFAVGKAHARWCAGRGQDGHREGVQPWAPSPFRTVPHRRKPGPSPIQPDLRVQAACRPVRLDRQETPHPMLGVLVGAAHSRLWMVHRRLLLAEMTPGQGSVAPTREVVAVRARPERPLAPRPGRLANAPRTKPSGMCARSLPPRKAGIHRDTAPRGNRLHYSPGIGLPVPEHKVPSALDARQAHRGWAPPIGPDPRSNRTSAPPSLLHGRRNTMRQRHFQRSAEPTGYPCATHLGGPGNRGATNPAHCDTTGLRPHNSGQAVTRNMAGLSIR